MIVNFFSRFGLSRSSLALLISSCVALAAFPSFASQSVTLNWDPSPSANVAGYNVYYGGNSLDYTNLLVAGNTTTLQITGLSEGKTYYFAATAYDNAGIESDFSPEISYWVPDTNTPPNLPPTISVIGNQIISKNSTLGPLAFVIGDPDTSVDLLTLSAMSSYPLLVPTANIVFGGSGSNRTVQVTPAANQSGSVSLAIVVTDDSGNSTVRPFSLTVLPTTGAGGSTPVVTNLMDATLVENGPATNLSFVVLDTDTPLTNLVVTVASDDALLFPSASLVLLGSGSNRVLRVTPALNRSGIAHLTVSATDEAGHTGTCTNTITVIGSEVAPSLLLLTSGSGTVTPNLSTRFLTVGKKYTVTATPAADFLFVGWSGDRVSSSATLTFTFVPNMVLQANFIPNPFVPASGTYNGLFAEDDGVRPMTAGALTASITRSGAYSGKVSIAGSSYPFSGKMNLLCQSTNRLKRGTNILTLTLRADKAGQISGLATQNSWVSPVQATRAGYNARTNPAPQAGNYTMLMPGKPADLVLPSGNSFGYVKVSAGGLASFVGSLADGTKVSQSAYISKDGLWPFYVPLYSGKGLMVSWQTFRTNLDTDLDGWLAWVKPANPAARFYPAGFDYERSVFGNTYAAPVGTNVVLSSSTLLVSFAYGDLPSNFANLARIDAGSKVVNLSSNKLTMNFSLSTGVFSGTVSDPMLNKKWSFGGVVMQGLNQGYGFLTGTNRSSDMALFPN